MCVGIFFQQIIPSGKSNTQPAPPPLQYQHLRRLQASSLAHLLRRFW
ncbi:hypothetical protein HH832_005304 [Escherichia coli]|nr:hypothetical protein [Escherichia coli]EFP9271707.1 hypothetical protein [Shigella flexneri]EFH1690457.1 hypothetical protein [Escherichia coli]EFH1705788.1 hypothetical protein [Escherichia coli]EFI3417168.1 hypothetical protein [Escherichia coli]